MAMELGWGLGLGCSPPSGTGLLGEVSVPRFPCTFGAAVTWGYSRYGPSGAAWRITVGLFVGMANGLREIVNPHE